MNFLKSRAFRAIASVGLAVLFFVLCPPCFSKLHLGLVLGAVVLIINLNTFVGRINFLTHLTRIAVGGLFIFSGFIKANDPVGFSYKLQEYFEVFGQGFSCEMKVAGEDAKGIPCQPASQEATVTAPPTESSWKPFWHFFSENSLFLAITLCAVEIVLGIFLLIGVQVRWTLWLLLAMIVFFSFLTFYSACCNKVTSCGCFGDAIKLTPWESFWKDLILLILITVLMVGEKNIKPIFKSSIALAGTAAIGTFLSFWFPVYTWQHLPVIDFRPYAIGTNYHEASQNKIPAETGCQPDSVKMTFYYKHLKTNEIKGFGIKELPEDTLWEWYCRYDEVLRKGNCAATIMDFNISEPESGMALNESLLQVPGTAYFVVMYDLSKTNRKIMGQVNAFYQECLAKGIPFNGLSAAGPEQIKAFRAETGAAFPIYYVDGTALKTVIRSNPGLVQLKKGVAIGMWHYNDFPKFKELTH
jgi:uncharacterized membrane protein YphA (DoxX/SURF4 family)